MKGSIYKELKYMQKSKKSIIIFMIIVIILIIIACVFIVYPEKTDRVLSMYNNIASSQRFTFSMEEENSEIEYKISIAQRGSDISIDMYTGDEHTSTLILEGHAYFIMHDIKEYYDYNSDDIDGDIIISGLQKASEQEYTTGTEEIYGKKYYYEEFENISTFMILLDENEDSVIKTRFYFDNDDIIYIKNIVQDEENTQEELLKSTLEYDAQESLFDIPADYAEK